MVLSVVSYPAHFTFTANQSVRAQPNPEWRVSRDRAPMRCKRRTGGAEIWLLKWITSSSFSKDWKRRIPSLLCHSQAPESTAANGDEEGDEEGGMGLSDFEAFVQLNAGRWAGHFLQFDILGRILQQIPTRLNAYAYGKQSDLTLYKTLNVKEPVSKTSVPGEMDEPTWSEMKLNDTNLSTAEKQQQIIYFPDEKAYCMSHQTAEMLAKLLRKGVLGEDKDENEESPNGVKLPSRRPALVSEGCLHSEDGNRRVRVFIVLDPRGLLDVIGIFNERKIEGEFAEVPNDMSAGDAVAKVDSLVGEWAGPAVTRRTGIYGSTVVESDVAVKYKRLAGGFISQEFTSSKGFTVNLTGQVRDSVLDFDGGLQTILLPGGVALSAPISVGRSVGRSQSFFFEFSWMEVPGKRRRLVRTFDTDGLVVSTTCSSETKL